jgi:hypothetical protein
MYLYKLAVLLILDIVFVQAWYTTVVENGTTIVRTKSRSRSSTATSTSITTTSTTTSSSTTTTSAVVSSPTFTVYFYNSPDCSGDIIQSSNNDGCFNFDTPQLTFSLDSTSSSKLSVDYYPEASCAGLPLAETRISPNACPVYDYENHVEYLSYTVTTL